MKLPFLKERRWPRVAQEPMEEKSYGLSSDEKLEAHCIHELMEAAASKDVASFRKAIEALVMNCFEDESNAA